MAEAPAQRSQFGFFFPIRARYAEIDGQGVVFNAHYSTYFDTDQNTGKSAPMPDGFVRRLEESEGARLGGAD